jgi:prepilin-type N-terminal cleavage/methylation domain-containing protein
VRRGFTLVEVVVAAVIIAMLAAVTTPSLLGFLDRERAQTTADKLAALGAGIAAFEAVVKTSASATSNSYPGALSELTNQITTVVATDKNSCGGAFTTTATNNWAAAGPFVTFYVPTTGYVTPIGTVSDALVRTPAAGGVGTLKLQLATVEDDAKNLDLIVDGGDGLAAGTVQWGAPGTAGGAVTVTYQVPVANKC